MNTFGPSALRIFVGSVVLSTLLACSDEQRSSFEDEYGDNETPRTNAEAAKSSEEKAPTFVASDAAAPKPKATGPVFYAHDGSAISIVDPSNGFSVTKVGVPSCLAGTNDILTDIAVTKDGRVFGVSFRQGHPNSVGLTFSDGLPANRNYSFAFEMEIQSNAVTCKRKWQVNTTLQINGNYAKFNSLSFAPIGTLDPVQEALVGGNEGGELHAIDLVTGANTLVGTLGTPINASPGQFWSFSGDIVFAANNGNPIGFAAARRCTDFVGTCEKVDALLEIDVAKLGPAARIVTKYERGMFTTRSSGAGCMPGGIQGATFANIYGLALLNDKVYAFDNDDRGTGRILSIDTKDANTCVVSTHPGLPFNGAGVTTSAPVIPPASPF
ncbi:MAG: hypothetical protein KBF88_07000 [Polyangiaceae bacterium]|nr:hypothetical protein [Polyangiaceae bacterium]